MGAFWDEDFEKTERVTPPARSSSPCLLSPDTQQTKMTEMSTLPVRAHTRRKHTVHGSRIRLQADRGEGCTLQQQDNYD